MRTVGWAGRGLRSPLDDALLANSVPAAARGRAFGFDEAADTAGPSPARWPRWGSSGLSEGRRDARGLQLVFWLSAIPGLLAAVSIVALVTEQTRPLQRNDAYRPPATAAATFRRYLAGVFVFGCGDFSHTMLILYAVQSLGRHDGQSAGAIGIAFTRCTTSFTPSAHTRPAFWPIASARAVSVRGLRARLS